MGRLGYYSEDLLIQHEVEERRRYKLQRKIKGNWKADAKAIRLENKSLLQREARREALTIIEDAARTATDYDRVTILWDCLDEIEVERLKKAEPKRTALLTQEELFRIGGVIPAPLKHVWWRELMAGKFDDLVFDCPHEIQELTSNRQIYDLTEELDENRKEILYYWSIRLWTPQRIAAFRSQTDRNIRKVYNKMMEEIQLEYFNWLYPRYARRMPLTVSQAAFVERYIVEVKIEMRKEKGNNSRE